MRTVLDDLAAIRVLPVVVIDDPAHSVALAEALLAGGVACAEVTLRTPRALEAVKLMSSVPGFLVGVGTVLSPRQAEESVANGARFIVSPGTSIPVIRASASLGVTCVPGVSTATEVMAALDEGLSTLKLFPAAQLGGAEVITALRGPFADASFVPSGGIGIDNAASYNVPGVSAVSTSWITPRVDIERGVFVETTERARRFKHEVTR